MIEVKDLQKHFGDLHVLNGINEVIHDGEVVVVIGPSGSGKSTFLRCLTLLEEPTGGQVIIDGQQINAPGVDINKVRQNIGMVFQHFNLFPHLTVRKNITLAPVKLKKMTQEQADAKAIELLTKVGLADKADAYPAQLSGGQKQRVAIARALITHPEIILADEPTGALDSKTSVEVMDLLTRLNREDGVTIIVVTHESGVANCADKIVHIKDGLIEKIEDNRQHHSSVFGADTIMK